MDTLASKPEPAPFSPGKVCVLASCPLFMHFLACDQRALYSGWDKSLQGSRSQLPSRRGSQGRDGCRIGQAQGHLFQSYQGLTLVIAEYEISGSPSVTLTQAVGRNWTVGQPLTSPGLPSHGCRREHGRCRVGSAAHWASWPGRESPSHRVCDCSWRWGAHPHLAVSTAIHQLALSRAGNPPTTAHGQLPR